jgi:regulator of sigma E protease
MKSVGGIILAVVILLAMVTIHEFGHYIAGKLLGFKINEFAVGFGPAIFKKRSKKTGELFALRVIPLGGYCAFDGEDYDESADTQEEKKEDEENPFDELSEDGNDVGRGEIIENGEKNEPTMSALNKGVKTPSTEEKKDKAEEYPERKGKRFNDQAPWKRIIVLLAGATMNYLLALVLLLIMVGVYGQPMCLVMPIGYNQEMTVPHETWETPTLSPRDVLLEINGKEISMFTDCMDALKGKKAGDEVSVTVLRLKESEWKEKEVTLVLQADADFKNMNDVEKLTTAMGLEVFTTTMQRGFWHTIGGAFDYSVEMGTAVLRSLGELLTGKLGLNAVGGPVTTITTTAQAASASPFSFLYIASFIGVNLAVFNLLPIPALDGCKVIFCLIEWIRKKPINRKVETIIHFVGIIAIFGFAILVDLLQLFR